MARYIDPEHADAEVRCLLCDNPVKSENGCDGSCHYDEDLYNKVMEVIGKLSTIDAIQIVRCYECKHGESWHEDDGFRRCTKIQQYGKVYPGNHYCGYAKRWGEDDV